MSQPSDRTESTTAATTESAPHETVQVSGHIIDSLLLPKILDLIIQSGGDFELSNVSIGHGRHDPSSATITVRADDAQVLERILAAIAPHGAVPVDALDCRLESATQDGVFPEGFYCTTNLDTEVRIAGEWLSVDLPEMDCGIVVSADHTSARTVPMSDVKTGELVVVSRQGTRVQPFERSRDTSEGEVFGFMASAVSSEKPKGVTIREIARAMRAAREGDGRILIVAGPAVVHTGSRDDFSRLIRESYVDLLFAGNALAAHDIEQSLYGTSLGISVKHGHSMHEGHEHHLRTINRIRGLGGIKQAVDAGVLKSGIMYECIQRKIPYVLAGSIRDDGPLPDVVTDAIAAQRAMRELVPGVTFCLMIATTLHSIATGNLLPAKCKVVCVDINPATVTKLADRGSFQTIGLVTDVEPFLRVLVDELGIERTAAPTHQG